jgi:hypothetical protein
MSIKKRLSEPSTWLGMGSVAVALPGIVGVGAEKADIARQGVEAVAAGLFSGLGLFPSLFLALGGVLGAVLGEKGDRQ